jgi:hypothetical protein
MKKITATLLFFLSISLTQAQEITVTSGTAFQIPGGVIVILPKIWTKGLVKKSLNLTKQYDKTNTPQIFA